MTIPSKTNNSGGTPPPKDSSGGTPPPKDKPPADGEMDVQNNRVFQNGQWVDVPGLGAMMAQQQIQQKQMIAMSMMMAAVEHKANMDKLVVNGFKSAMGASNQIQ